MAIASMAPGIVLVQGPQFVPGPLKPGSPEWWAQRPHRPAEPKVQAAPVDPGVQARKLDLRVPKTPPEPAPEDEPVPSHFKRPTAHYGMSGMVPVERPYVFCLHIILGSV